MAAPQPPPPPALKPEIGPDGIARDAPVIAYTEKVRSHTPFLPPPKRVLDSSIVQCSIAAWFADLDSVGWFVVN